MFNLKVTKMEVNKNKLVASEYVSFGHPDKIADQIADALLDAYLENDRNSRCGIEVLVKDNIVVLGGEVHSNVKIDYDKIVREIFESLYFSEEHHLSPNDIKIINLIGKQSEEIHSGVDKDDTVAAGDQGFMVGYASNETSVFMPLGHYIARTICHYIANDIVWAGPDTKTQVIVEYDENGKAVGIQSILVSTMYNSLVPLHGVRNWIDSSIRNNEMGLEEELYEKFIKDKDIDIKVNPCGPWLIGGPVSDCGVTGRKLVVDAYGGYCNIGGGAFCVDGDTEYIGEDLKWHKIKDYNGENIGQWNNGILEFVKPSHYHINPAEKMYHFHNSNTIDMVLSENHDVVCKTSKNNLHKVKVKEIIEKINNNVDGFKDTIPCTFEYYGGNGIELTDDQIRLQVAFCADGTYKSIPGDKGRINIKKKNKIERLEWLLKRTGTEYTLLDKGEYQNHYYTFVPPVPNNKSLYDIFKNANFRQLSIIAKEVLLWDGNDKSNVFRTTLKEDADFIQFVFSIVYNKRVSILKDNRVGEEHTLNINGKKYTTKSITYSVTIGKTKEISMMTKNGVKTTVEPYDTDKMYCFTVESGMLLLRRNDKIFVTGNCGKDLSKVDRSGAYMARYLAKNIVATGLFDTAKVTLSYTIGIEDPSSLEIEVSNNNELVGRLKKWIVSNVDLTPSGFIKQFSCNDNCYNYQFYFTSRNGHFGYEGDDIRPWEYTDIANDIREYLTLTRDQITQD